METVRRSGIRVTDQLNSARFLTDLRNCYHIRTTVTPKVARSSIATRLAPPGANLDAVVGTVLKRPEAIDELLSLLASENTTVRYRAAKVLRRVSERRPPLLYPHFDVFVRLFEGSNTIHRWNATFILGNLAPADRENRLEAIFDRFFAPILGTELIGAANVIVAAASIAEAKPHLANRIAARILDVERASYGTPECRNVAIGHAIKSLDRFFPSISDSRGVLDFVSRQLENPRPATRRKAAAFLKRRAAA